MSIDRLVDIDADPELRLAAGVIRRALHDAARDPDALAWLASGLARPWVACITPAGMDPERVVTRLIERAQERGHTP